MHRSHVSVLSNTLSLRRCYNKSVFSLAYSAVNVALPAFAAERRAAPPCCGAFAAGRPIDISCTRGAQQQTRRAPLLRPNYGTDRQMDAHPHRYVDPAPHTMRTVPICTIRCVKQGKNVDIRLLSPEAKSGVLYDGLDRDAVGSPKTLH